MISNKIKLLYRWQLYLMTCGLEVECSTYGVDVYERTSYCGTIKLITLPSIELLQ